MTTVPNIRRGGQGAEEASKTGGKFAKINYFSLDDKESKIYRFLTDSPDWFWVKQHPSVPTKNKPEDFTGNWPSSMPAVCRHDEAFAGIYTDCYICDTPVMSPHDASKPLKPAIRVWALAIEREKVEEGGVVKGYRTVMEEVPERNEKGEETGKNIRQPKIVVVNMGVKNFFSGLQGIYGLFNTVCDRDYMIRRTGTGLDTDYQIIPLDKIPGVEPGTDTWAKFEKAVADQNIDLLQVIADRASDEYYARFFDPTKTPTPTKGKEEGGASTTAATTTPPAGDSGGAAVDPDRLAAMRDRVRGTGSNAGAEAPAAEAPAAEPDTAPQQEAPEPTAPATGPVNYD